MPRSTTLHATSVTLRILIILNWVFGGFILAMLAISFQAEAWTWRALKVGAVEGHQGAIAGMRAIMVLGIVGVPLGYVVFRLLLRIVQSVGAGQAFTMDNAGRLRTIAWALLGLQLLHVAVAAIASTIRSHGVPLHVGGNLQVGGWLAVLLLFVLAQVFLEGSRMREDLEGTV